MFSIFCRILNDDPFDPDLVSVGRSGVVGRDCVASVLGDVRSMGVGGRDSGSGIPAAMVLLFLLKRP